MGDKKIVPTRKFPIQSVEVTVEEGYWARTENPHPLVTLDYDVDGNLLQVSVIGVDLRVGTENGDPLALSILKGNPDLDHEKYVADYERSRAHT